MKPKVLYLGRQSGNSLLRFEALSGLPVEATMLAPLEALSFLDKVPLIPKSGTLAWGLGGFGFERLIARWVLSKITTRPDAIIVDGGDLLGASLVNLLRRSYAPIGCLNLENPFTPRDKRRWRLFLQALPEYSAVFFPRESSVDASLSAGARAAYRIWQAADDRLRNASALPSEEAKDPFRARVAFTGTWMPGREAFILRLHDAGVPIKVNGPRWDRAIGYAEFKQIVRLGDLSPANYNAAIAAADISIGLVSEGNLDTHTTRSMEVPLLESAFCATRTADHEALYDDMKEAALWSSVEECASVCLDLLAQPERLINMRHAGRARALQNGNFNSELMRTVLEITMGQGQDRKVIMQQGLTSY